MTNLERRAQLGDREAQEECTRQGIVLPCQCGGEAKFVASDPFLQFWWVIRCTECGTQTGSRPTDRAALAAWNTRQAPPIGRCGDCAYSQNIKPNRKGFNICPASGMEITNADFCSYFEPKVHKKETDHETD